MPWQPAAAKALRSAWIPAPPPESEPAIVRHLGTNSLPSPALTGSGSTGVISATGAPRSGQGSVSHMRDVQELRAAWDELLEGEELAHIETIAAIEPPTPPLP